MSALPLEGLTVVAVEQAVAAPFATRHLADLGARVIKVERPEGDFARGYDDTVHGESSYFVWLNRSKESIVLDLKSDQGRQVMAGLLADADVLVQNLAPGACRRLGLHASAVRRRHPHLIVCSISGFGSSGSWSERKAYDMLVQAEVGLMSITGTPEVPVRVGISIADIAAGMYAYSAILTALYHRAATGEATAIEVSLFDALAEWMGAPAQYTRYGGDQPPRVGARHATIAPYGTYTTMDGVTMVLAIQNEREWTSLCDSVLAEDALARDPRFTTNSCRVANRAALDQLIVARLASMTHADVVELLDRAGIANARLRDLADLTDHPVLRERGRWQTVDSPGGSFEALLPPADLAGLTVRMGPVPALGEHTDAVLAELGMSPETGRRAVPHAGPLHTTREAR